MKKNRIQAVLFDLDGTLIDTEPTAAQAVQECFAQWGHEITPSDAQYVTGRTWASALDYLFLKYCLPIAKESATHQIQKRYRQTLEANLPQVPGAVETVENLASHYRLGLVSGSFRHDILWALDTLRIAARFEIILGAENYTHGKPNPEGYLKAVHTLQVNPQECLVFEDSQPGIQAARAAGLWVVAVTGTNHFHQDQSQAHYSVADLLNINSEWIGQLSFD
jgi:HAD superfamily hydrolase (TIGR01509 family)